MGLFGTCCRLFATALPLCVQCACGTNRQAKAVNTFGMEDVRAMAAELARQPYRPPADDLPASLRDMDYDGYQSITFHSEDAVHLGRFQLEFFHRGYLYPDRVDMFILHDQRPALVKFSPTLYKYWHGQPRGLSDNLGFAGFRVFYQPPGYRQRREIANFLGASYFRAVGLNDTYGASARGIAVDTYVPGAKEEFPAFRSFWIVPPERQDNTLTIFALLVGPSLTGAYRFDIHPGDETDVDVQASLYPREPIKKLGFAPLTSMFYYGKPGSEGPAKRNYRPEVHDSDGLLIHSDDLWQWRPLHNPGQRRVSVFHVNRLEGFGLLQRNTNPDDYLDATTNSQNRPSVWVEPHGQWTPGNVELLELSAAGEGQDNIAAQFIPDAPVRAGTELNLSYRLRFFKCHQPMHEGLRTIATRRFVLGPEQTRYEVEFEGSVDATDLQPAVTADGSIISNCTLKPGRKPGSWMLRFDVTAGGKTAPIELRAYIHAGSKTLSETWCDSWNP